MSDWDEEETDSPSVVSESRTNVWKSDWRQAEETWPAKSGDFTKSANSYRDKGRGRANRFGSWNNRESSENPEWSHVSNENSGRNRGFGRASNWDSSDSVPGSKSGFRKGRANGWWSDDVNGSGRSSVNRRGEDGFGGGNRSCSVITVASDNVGRIIGQSDW